MLVKFLIDWLQNGEEYLASSFAQWTSLSIVFLEASCMDWMETRTNVLTPYCLQVAAEN